MIFFETPQRSCSFAPEEVNGQFKRQGKLSSTHGQGKRTKRKETKTPRAKIPSLQKRGALAKALQLSACIAPVGSSWFAKNGGDQLGNLALPARIAAPCSTAFCSAGCSAYFPVSRDRCLWLNCLCLCCELLLKDFSPSGFSRPAGTSSPLPLGQRNSNGVRARDWEWT